jgi:hypothetical protein
MALVFDSLGYSRRLRDAGLDPKVAEAAADAARDYIMPDLVAQSELREALDNQRLRLTVRMGVMLAAGLSIFAAYSGFTRLRS